MSDNKQVLATLNPLGYKIGLNEIDSVLSPKTSNDEVISKWVSHFFRTTPDKLTNELLARYVRNKYMIPEVSKIFNQSFTVLWFIRANIYSARCA